MNLKYIEDKVLRIDSIDAALREKESYTELLHYIGEVDRRKLYCDWKFTSLFDWCVRELKLCEGSAQLRITAARLLMEFPDLELKIQSGLLKLTTISLVNQYCRENKIQDPKEKKRILEEVENLSKSETEKKLFRLSGKEKVAKEGKERISEDKHKVTLILTDKTLSMLDEARSLLGRKISYDELIFLMARALKDKIEKEKFKQTKNPRQRKGTPVSGRVLPAEVKRHVYQRDQCCSNCGSQYNLHYDHINPYALGGSSDEENIRLLCFNCNQRAGYRMGLLTSSG